MSQDPKRILVVVPAFNEEEVVGRTVSEVLRHVPHADVLVVDDGSRDQTGARAALAGASIARLPFNLGVGGAMRLGYRYAVENDYDYAIQVDADGQHDPAFIRQPDRTAGRGYDVVIGARFLPARGDYEMTDLCAWRPRCWPPSCHASATSHSQIRRHFSATSCRASGKISHDLPGGGHPGTRSRPWLWLPAMT